MTYSSDVYTWNHYDGESPDMDAIGLPLNYSGADLPTSIPETLTYSTDSAAALDQVPYSPALVEMGTDGVAAHSQVAPSVPQPAKPGLWQAVGNAIFGGSVQKNLANSTAAVASGTNTTIKTGQ
jgi:hypothetical protein